MSAATDSAAAASRSLRLSVRHTKVQIEATDREGLERLCRYIARPSIKVKRLLLDPAGRVIYALRRHWHVGTWAIAFLSRLAALVPRPRAHLLTFHGVLAPAPEWRGLVVPSAKVKSSPSPESAPHLAPKAHHPTPSTEADAPAPTSRAFRTR